MILDPLQALERAERDAGSSIFIRRLGSISPVFANGLLNREYDLGCTCLVPVPLSSRARAGNPPFCGKHWPGIMLRRLSFRCRKSRRQRMMRRSRAHWQCLNNMRWLFFPHRMRYIMRLRICRMETGRARALASLGIAQPDYRVIAPSVQDRAQGAQYTEAYGSEALADALDQRLGLASLARRRALILRADRGREWLAKVLDAHHARVDTVAAYQCIPAIPAASQWTRIRALIAGCPHTWLLTSSAGVRDLSALARTQLSARDLRRLTEAPIVAPHARIAHAARAAGFARMMQSGLSDESITHALLASIRSFSRT